MSKPNSEKELLKLGPLAYLLYSAHSHFSTCKLAEAPIFFALVTTFPQTHFWSHKHAECIKIGYGYMACAPLSRHLKIKILFSHKNETWSGAIYIWYLSSLYLQPFWQ